MTLPLKTDPHRRWTTAAELECLIHESGLIEENRLIMLSALKQHFEIAELRPLNLLHLCELYRMLVQQSVADPRTSP